MPSLRVVYSAFMSANRLKIDSDSEKVGANRSAADADAALLGTVSDGGQLSQGSKYRGPVPFMGDLKHPDIN
jgi:hypothetical protein